jgi:hypothetical protein
METYLTQTKWDHSIMTLSSLGGKLTLPDTLILRVFPTLKHVYFWRIGLFYSIVLAWLEEYIHLVTISTLRWLATEAQYFLWPSLLKKLPQLCATQSCKLLVEKTKRYNVYPGQLRDALTCLTCKPKFNNTAVRDSPEGPLKQMGKSRLKPAKNQSQTHLA